MNRRYKIAIDAMGGDNAPDVVIEGALAALQEKDDFEVIFVGDRDKIEECLKDKTYDKDRMNIVHTTQIIEMAESPVAALRQKKDSSMAVAFKLVREKEADGAVSAGNTGAIIAGATMILGRLEGVARPVLSATLPTLKEHNVILLDAGANVDCRPGYLQQFAIMASVYLENVEGIENPTIGLLSNGSEEEKGDALTKEAYALIKECDINFAGNIEAREAQSGNVHAIICDGFAGNVLLKTVEGTAQTLFTMIKRFAGEDPQGMKGMQLMQPVFTKLFKKMDYNEHGGAPLLGVRGGVVKAHGGSGANSIRICVLQARQLAHTDAIEKIRVKLAENK